MQTAFDKSFRPMNPSPSIPGRKLPNALPRFFWITFALTLGLWAARPARAQPTDLPGSSPPAAEEWRVVERGQDFAVFQRFRARTQADGSLRWQPGGRYTLLENGLHYRDPVSGQWQESRDLIERFPDGAIARYGPLRAIFSHDLNTESVFDLETPAGARLRGGLRALEWLDEATGQRQLLAGVKPSAPLELVPPNWLVARDAFDGVAADVVLEWRHDRFSQNVVLRELPWPPEGFAPGTTRLVVVTEFLETPEPVLQRVTVPGAGGQAVPNNVGIHFDGASILQGHAFAVRAGSEWALQVGAGGAPGEAVEVRKVWTPDGAVGAVLEESVAWEALARLAADLPRQARAAAPAERPESTASVERVSARRPVAVAQLPYRPAGVVVDFEILPGSASGFTFQMGQTYYVRNNFYVGPGPVTFQPGCVIKFKHNTWLLAYGPVSFPGTGPAAVLTSRNDDLYGEHIAGVPGEADSDGNASLHRAAQAVWIYYPNFGTTIQNAVVRWAQRAIQYDMNPGVYVTHTLQSSSLQHADVGVYANLQNATLVLNSVKQCNVTTPLTCPGYPYYPCGSVAGSIITDCGVVNASRWTASQGEPAIAVRTLPTGETVVVVVAMNPEYKYPGSAGERSLLKMISMDNGRTWVRTTIADGNPSNPAGDMLQAYSDPALAFDDFGNLFLTYNAYPPLQAALYVSSDNGQTFQLVPGFDGGNHYDLPRVAVGPSGLTGPGNPPQAVWISRARNDGISVSGAPIRGVGLANIGPNWTTTIIPQPPDGSRISSVAVGPAGEVLVSYVNGTSDTHPAPRTIYFALDLDGLGTAHSVTQLLYTIVCNVSIGTYINANPNGFAAPFVHVDWDRGRDRAYIVYPDRATIEPDNQNLDIYVRFSTDKGITWSEARRVNDDSGTKTQFHPRLAVDQLSGYVAVSWYDCRKDPANTRAWFFATVSRDGFASSTPPRNFQLNPTGSLATLVDWAHYYDYSGLAFYRGWLYPVWGDLSNGTGNNPDGTSKPDILVCPLPF
jgi:hypothetical protein